MEYAFHRLDDCTRRLDGLFVFWKRHFGGRLSEEWWFLSGSTSFAVNSDHFLWISLPLVCAECYGVSRVSAGMMTKIVSASPVEAEVEIELPEY